MKYKRPIKSSTIKYSFNVKQVFRYVPIKKKNSKTHTNYNLGLNMQIWALLEAIHPELKSIRNTLMDILYYTILYTILIY